MESFPNGRVMYYTSSNNILGNNNSNSANSLINEFFNNISEYLDEVENDYEDVPIVLSNDELEKLNKLTVDEVKKNYPNIDLDIRCSICLVNFLNLENNEDNEDNEDNENHELTILNCKHYFHYNCLREYLENYDYHCPICKREVGNHVAKL